MAGPFTAGGRGRSLPVPRLTKTGQTSGANVPAVFSPLGLRPQLIASLSQTPDFTPTDSYTNSMFHVFFNFSNAFEIHDDNEVLKRMGLQVGYLLDSLILQDL